MHVIAEILDHENVAHAETAGADEVIETARLGFALMAHSVSAKGSGQVLSTVASAGAVSMYIGRAPAAESFGAIAAGMKHTHGATVIGVRDSSGAIVFSPPDGQLVAVGTGLIYLAPRAVLDPV